MAVYTALDENALTSWLASHDVGALVEWHGIHSGIENSNYFVTTCRDGVARRFVLTLFERLGAAELPFYLSLMQHLAERGVPCPAPMADRTGALCATLAGKPAALVTRLEGHFVAAPTAAHCAAIGGALARMHLAGEDFPLAQTNPRGLAWWQRTAAHVRPFLDDAQKSLLDDEIVLQTGAWDASTASLPRGPIHADLFRDNALFIEGDAASSGATPATTPVAFPATPPAASPLLGGIIDFYFAGCDAWLLDLAICVNDWCVDLASGTLDRARVHAMVDGYTHERPLRQAERETFTLALRAAALRFWLSRLDDFHRPRPAQLLTPHDPMHFERILRRRRDESTGRVECGGRDILDILGATVRGTVT